MKLNQRWIRCFAGVLLAVFLIGFLPVSARAAGVHDHTADTALTAADTEISASGNYYLAGDLTLPKTLTVTGGNVELCLNGHLLTSVSGNCVVIVKSGATLTIADCYDPQTHSGEAYTHQYVTPKSEEKKPEYVTVQGGLITGNNERGCIQVSDGTVHIQSGTIAGGKTTNGGGVCILKTSAGTGALFLYDGASIIDNAASVSGGGVFVAQQNKGGFTMYGGTVSDNSAEVSGGGVHVGIMSRFTMESGLITDNRQTVSSTQTKYGGGGIFLHTLASFLQSGGTICNNTAAAKGGGVLLSAGSEISLSGAVEIADNTREGIASDLAVLANTTPQGLAKIKLTGPLNDGARIGVYYTRSTLEDAVTLITADDGYNGGAIPAEDFEKFFSDDTTRSLLWNEAGEIALCVGRVHAVCGASCTHGPGGASVHSQALFQALPADYTGGPLAPGAYYLSENMTLHTPMTISGTVNLCLNGHELKNAAGRVIQVEPGASLTLCDCYAPRTHTGTEYTHTYKNPQTKADVTVSGGLLVGNHSLTTTSGGVEVSGGSFTFYSGTIGGASSLGGVRVTGGGQFTLSGGTISDCLSSGSGGGVYADAASSFTMTGGRILSNRARGEGGGVYAETGFSLSGDVRIIGNFVGAVENNVYLPTGTKIAVTGPVDGQVGITMERRGVFTTGGAAPYVRSFRADASVGTFADVLGKELCLSGYGVSVQPTPETRTVIMRSPENVAGYQWYPLRSQPLSLSDVTGAECAYDPASGLWTYSFTADADSFNCFEIWLGEGDTLRVKSLSGLGSVSLMESVTTEGGTVLETSVASGAPDYEGFYDVTACKAGNYTLCVDSDTLWQAGDTCSVSIDRYVRGAAAPHQTGATFTGNGGYYICKIEYDDGITALYSAPFQPGTHSHDGAAFTALAGTLSGDLLAGEDLRGDFTLESGSYALHGDTALSGSLRIPSGAAVTLCLNGCALTCENAGAIVVEQGGALELCDCQTGGSVSGKSAQNGGGLLVEGDAILHAGIFTGGSASGHGGGIYLAPTGTLTVSGNVQVTGNAPDDLYLAAGRRITFDAPLHEDASIGIAMERLGVFTDGAGGAYQTNFFPNETGTALSQVNDELALWAYIIVTQPTVDDPTVVVGHPDGAVYQWYTAIGEAVIDPQDPRCDKATGRWTPNASGDCCTLTLEQGQILRVVPTDPLPEGASITLSGAPLTRSADGAYLLTVAEAGAYPLQISAPVSVSVERYTVEAPLEGQTGDTLTAGPGGYVCRISWPDGTELQSHLLVIPSEPDRPEPGVPPVLISGDHEKEKPVVTPNPFLDVEEDAWYYDDVLKAYERGWMLGTDETHFSPDMSMSRGMLVTILWRISGAPVSTGELPFVDVPADAYYSMAIRWAVEKGIAYGVDPAHFCPEETANREQMAAFFHRSTSVWTVSLPSGRTAPSPWAQEDVNWAVSEGLLVGGSDGIDPMGVVTRAQFTVVLSRFTSLFSI